MPEARRGEANADACIRIHRPPVANHLLVGAGILMPVRHQIALRMFTRRVALLAVWATAAALAPGIDGPDRQDVPAQARIGQRIIDRLWLILDDPYV